MDCCGFLAEWCVACVSDVDVLGMYVDGSVVVDLGLVEAVEG